MPEEAEGVLKDQLTSITKIRKTSSSLQRCAARQIQAGSLLSISSCFCCHLNTCVGHNIEQSHFKSDTKKSLYIETKSLLCIMHRPYCQQFSLEVLKKQSLWKLLPMTVPFLLFFPS